MTHVYLAEPIDLTSGSDSFTDRIADRLAEEFNVYRPRGAWRCGGGLDPRVDKINRCALAASDVLVAHLPAQRASVGVPMEIEFAANLGIPVVVLADKIGQSLLRPGVQLSDSLDGLPSQIRALGRRKVEVSSSRELRFKKLHPEAKLPTRAFTDDAGLDLYTMGDHFLKPGEFADVPTGIAIQLPAWAWGEITGRSSTLRKYGLLVNPGVIDTGWRGPLFCGVQNVGQVAVQVKDGSRLGQLIVHDNATARCVITEVAELDPHERGLNGFGSSGI